METGVSALYKYSIVVSIVLIKISVKMSFGEYEYSILVFY